MMTAVRILLMVTVWLLLWSDLTLANVVGGLIVALGIVTLFDTWLPGRAAIRPVHAARFLGFFAYKLVESTIAVARTVVAPRHRIHTGIVAVPLRGCSDAVATLIANAITLTPGTLTLEVRRTPLTLYVHALDTRDIEQVRRDVRTLEVLAVRAFGDEAAIAGLDVDDSTVWRVE